VLISGGTRATITAERSVTQAPVMAAPQLIVKNAAPVDPRRRLRIGRTDRRGSRQGKGAYWSGGR
jgi:hypothetical protein